MNFKELTYFLEIAKCGTLSEAARNLSVSQPTLSVFLANLEEKLGKKLFIKEKKRLHLTPEGEIFLDAAERILAVRERTLSSLATMQQNKKKIIRIGTTPNRGSIIFSDIYSKVRTRFPNVELQVVESNMLVMRENVRNGKVDMAFGTCWTEESEDMDFYMISKEEIVAAVPSFHPLSHKFNCFFQEPTAQYDYNRFLTMGRTGDDRLPSIRVEELLDSPIVLQNEGTAIRAICDELFEKAGVKPTVILESFNNLALRHMIHNGIGVGFLPYYVIDRQLNNICYFSLDPKIYMILCCLTKKGHVLSEEEKYVIALLTERDRRTNFLQPYYNDKTRKIFSDLGILEKMTQGMEERGKDE